MGDSLNVVALVSGGKDSFFSILHCRANGHNVVALANLYPAQNQGEPDVEDIDSFMYQTIGHTVIPLYEEALGIPLYRQEIAGTAVNQHKSYGRAKNDQGSDPDETESLIPLLQQVVQAQSEVNAVCTGAILSDYQRTRVESVAIRLGLTPLSYLWQFPSLPPGTETSLLEDMLAVGQDSRIIKVASGGLDESFLWQNVADRQTISRLTKAAARFGISGDGAVLGEGGEFETLAVQGPWPTWKGRISVESADRECVEGEAGTASSRIRAAKVVSFSPSDHPERNVRIPALLDPRFQATLDEMVKNHDYTSQDDGYEVDPRSRQKSPGLLIPNTTGKGVDAREQIRAIMDQITIELAKHGHGLDDIVYTSIIMRDMADFHDINGIYGLYFSEPNPPSRVTLACRSALPAGSHLAVAVSSAKKPKATIKKGLHVQSRSYWAPANIGPYSQAISVPMASTEEISDCELVYIAGQIPLVPASMDIIRIKSATFQEQFAHEAVLALQHLFRIGAKTNVRCFAEAIAFVVVDAPAERDTITNIARGAWYAAHETHEPYSEVDDSVEIDVWDLKNRPGQFASAQTRSDNVPSQLHFGCSNRAPALTVIAVDALPRSAKIEWVAYGLTKELTCTAIIPHLDLFLDTFKGQIL